MSETMTMVVTLVGVGLLLFVMPFTTLEIDRRRTLRAARAGAPQVTADSQPPPTDR